MLLNIRVYLLFYFAIEQWSDKSFHFSLLVKRSPYFHEFPFQVSSDRNALAENSTWSLLPLAWLAIESIIHGSPTYRFHGYTQFGLIVWRLTLCWWFSAYIVLYWSWIMRTVDVFVCVSANILNNFPITFKSIIMV